jgi:hypothetical protein
MTRDSLFQRFKEWISPPMTVERGRKCATEFLAEKPSQERIDNAYLTGYSVLHPDNFDEGWCETLRPHVSPWVLEL